MKVLGINLPPTRKVIVSNLHPEVNEAKLFEVFSLAGEVKKVNIFTAFSGRQQAKIEYDHPLEAVQAISMLHKHNLYNIAMHVRMDFSRKEQPLPLGLSSVGQGLGFKGETLRGLRIIAELKNVNESLTELGVTEKVLKSKPVTVTRKWKRKTEAVISPFKFDYVKRKPKSFGGNPTPAKNLYSSNAPKNSCPPQSQNFAGPGRQNFQNIMGVPVPQNTVPIPQNTVPMPHNTIPAPQNTTPLQQGCIETAKDPLNIAINKVLEFMTPNTVTLNMVQSNMAQHIQGSMTSLPDALKTQTSWSLPLQTAQSLPSQTAQPLPPQIAQLLPSQTAQPLPPQIPPPPAWWLPPQTTHKLVSETASLEDKDSPQRKCQKKMGREKTRQDSPNGKSHVEKDSRHGRKSLERDFRQRRDSLEKKSCERKTSMERDSGRRRSSVERDSRERSSTDRLRRSSIERDSRERSSIDRLRRRSIERDSRERSSEDKNRRSVENTCRRERLKKKQRSRWDSEEKDSLHSRCTDEEYTRDTRSSRERDYLYRKGSGERFSKRRDSTHDEPRHSRPRKYSEERQRGSRERDHINKKSPMLVFKNLPSSVSSECLSKKMGQLGPVEVCEIVAGGRAFIRFHQPHLTERCIELFHLAKVDGQIIEVDYL